MAENQPQLFRVELEVSTCSQTALRAPFPPPPPPPPTTSLSFSSLHLAPSVCAISSPLFLPMRQSSPVLYP